jgi:hypothetical protein
LQNQTAIGRGCELLLMIIIGDWESVTINWWVRFLEKK